MNQVFLMFYAITCGFTAYYFFKFYLFYKNSYDMSLDTRKNILWFYYEMKLNIELYKALTYIVAFIGAAFLAVYLFVERASIFVRILSKLSSVYILLNCFISILIIGAITELWAWYYYGKHIKQIKAVVDELDYEWCAVRCHHLTVKLDYNLNLESDRYLMVTSDNRDTL